MWPRDAESVHTSRSAGTQDLRTVNTTFTFDPEVFNSKVYQTATRSNMIHALLSAKRDVSNDASSLSLNSNRFVRSRTANLPMRTSNLRSRPRRALHSTSIMESTIPEADETLAADRRPNASGIMVSKEISISYSDMPSLSQPEGPARLFGIFSRATAELEGAPVEGAPVEDAPVDLKSLACTTLSMSHKDYLIHTRETLRPLPNEAALKYMPPPSTDWPKFWSSVTSEDSWPLRDLPAQSQRVRSRRRHVPRIQTSGSNTFGKHRQKGVIVLVLGIADSGKSTLQRSMKISFDNDDDQWRVSFIPAIHMSLAMSLRALASKAAWDWGKCRVIDQWIQTESLRYSDMCSFPPKVASAVKNAIKDQISLGPEIDGSDPSLMDCTK